MDRIDVKIQAMLVEQQKYLDRTKPKRVVFVKVQGSRLHSNDTRFIRNGDGQRFGGWRELSRKV